jgi:hypothetical protein
MWLWTFRERRDAKRDAGSVHQHALPAEVESVSIEADASFDVAGATKEMNEAS